MMPNKRELFSLLSKSIYDIHGLIFATTENGSIFKNIIRNCISCSHDEADTNMFVHLKHAIEHDQIKTACIHLNDTELVIIAVSFFCRVEQARLSYS